MATSIAALRRDVRSAVERGDLARESDARISLAERLRNDGKQEEAMEEYTQVRRVAEAGNQPIDRRLAVRALAEMNADQGNEAEAIELLQEYESLVRNCPTELQLMTTVAAWCYLQLFAQNECRETLLEAKKSAERSIWLLENERMDPSRMEKEETKSIRRVNVCRMLSQVHGFLDDREQAEMFSEKAMESAKDKKEQFEIYLGRMDFSWIDEVATALRLVEMAEKAVRGKVAEAHIILANAYFKRGDVEKGMRALANTSSILNSKAAKSLNEEDREKYSKLLIFAYKACEREVRVMKCKGDRRRLYKEHDKLGALFDDAGFKAPALAHYQMALDVAETEQETRAALIWCAETAVELRKHAEAERYWQRLLEVERRMGKDTVGTEVALFKTRLEAGTIGERERVIMDIDKMEREGNRLMKVVYDIAWKYFESRGDKEQARRYKQLEKEWPEADTQGSEEGDEGGGQNDDDSLDEMDTNVILQIMRGRNQLRVKQIEIGKSKNKKNNYGESKLMQCARDGKMDEIEELLKQKVDVNETDVGGWTALHEAVAANNKEIVRRLLRVPGINTNSASTLGWQDSDFRGGITPLMEACTNGFVDIARWLLNTRSVSLVMATNGNGWCAADFMKDHIAREPRGERSEAEYQQHLKDCREILATIMQRQTLAGYPVRQGPPPQPARLSDDTEKFAAEKRRAARRSAEMAKEIRPSDDYKSAIAAIGSRNRLAEKAKKKRSKEAEERFTESDDEPLVVIALPSSSSARKKRALVSSDEEDEKEKATPSRGGKENKRRTTEESMFGLGEGERAQSSQSSRGAGGEGSAPGSQRKIMSGVERMMQIKGGGRNSQGQQLPRKKKAVDQGMIETENGIGIVSDHADIEIMDEKETSKRRRNDSESSQSESGGRRSASLSSMDWRQQSGDSGGGGGAARRPGCIGGSTVSSPPPFDYSESRTSLTSGSSSLFAAASSSPAAAPMETTTLRVTVVRPDQQPVNVIGAVQSDSEIRSLLSQLAGVRGALNGETTVQWIITEYDSFLEDNMRVRELGGLTTQRPIRLECRARRTLRGEYEKRIDATDRGGLLSAALDAFEKTRPAALVIEGGAKYSKRVREAFFAVLAEFAAEKAEKETGKWRVDRVAVDQWDLSPSALVTLFRLPVEGLSLRYCGIDDEKMEGLVQALESSELGSLKSLDLSYNDQLTTSAPLERLLRRVGGVTNLVLQGLTGLEDGRDLMRTLASLPLHVICLDENLWLDDEAMEALTEGENARLVTLKISKVSVRSLNWLEKLETVKCLKSLSLAENRGIGVAGSTKLAAYLHTGAASLRNLELRGTGVRPSILESLMKRPLSSPLLTLALSRCVYISAPEIMNALFSSDVSPNFKLLLESTKVKEIAAANTDIASKFLKSDPNPNLGQ